MSCWMGVWRGAGGAGRAEKEQHTCLLLGRRCVAFCGPQSLVRRPAACAARALPRRTATTARATECHSWPAGAASMRSVGIRRTQQPTPSCTTLHRRLLLLHELLACPLTRANHSAPRMSVAHFASAPTCCRALLRWHAILAPLPQLPLHQPCRTGRAAQTVQARQRAADDVLDELLVGDGPPSPCPAVL